MSTPESSIRPAWAEVQYPHWFERETWLARQEGGELEGVETTRFHPLLNELLGYNAGTAPYTLQQYGYSWGAQPL